MATKKVILLLIENGCTENVSDDELCKSLAQYTIPRRKSKKKALSMDADTPLYAKDMVVIKRSDIELNARERDEFEMKACLEDYHIDNLNDFVEDKLEDLEDADQDKTKSDESPIYVVLNGICDHIDDVKKLRDNHFEIRTFIHISDKEEEKDEDEEVVEPETTEQEPAETKEQGTGKKNISVEIRNHFLNQDNYQKYECLDNIILHQLNGWKMVTNKKGLNEMKYKDLMEICQEIRRYIHQIQNEWNVYDTNWRNEQLSQNETKPNGDPENAEQENADTEQENNGNPEDQEAKQEQAVDKIPVIEIPQTKLKNITEFEIYNKFMNNTKSPNVSSIISSMIEQVAINIDANDTTNDIDNDTNNGDAAKANEDESGVYRYGDIISQNNYLNKISEQEIEANKRIWCQFSKSFIESLFKENQEIDRNTFESQTTARYTFSKLNPGIFDDALMYNCFNQLLSAINITPSSPIHERIHREDLTETELIQRIQKISSNPLIKSSKKYVDWMDGMLLLYYMDIPCTRYQEANMNVFLSSNMGFREWMKLPQHLKDIKPNAFYQSNQPQFLYHNTLTLYPTNHWFMGLSSFDSMPNTMDKKPYLFLRDHQNSVITISTNNDMKSVHFNVHFEDDAQLSFTRKSIEKSPENEVADDAEKIDEPEETADDEMKEETLITPQPMNDKEDIISISLPNEITMEYHCNTGHLLIYYQSALQKYQLLQQQQEENEDVVDDDKPKENETADPKEKEVQNEEETPEEAELETVDVSWNHDNNETFVVWRSINKQGIITIFYSDNSQRKLFPTSETWYKSPTNEDNEWIKVKSNGECMVNEVMKKPLNIATTTDSETNTKIVTRADNVLVFCHLNGDGFIQYPDSSHIFVKSNISSKEWDLHQLSLWMQSMGVNTESSHQISNLSQNIIDQTAEKLKSDLTEIRFELKNDVKMPTVIVDTKQNNTKIIFYDGFDATFSHPMSAENKLISTINHSETGTFMIYDGETMGSEICFTSKDSESFKIEMNDENPSISMNETVIKLNGEYKVDDAKETKSGYEPRAFVVYRDGSGYELLSNDEVTKFTEYLKNYEPKPQILEPKPLFPATDDSPLSHKFVMERFMNNPPRTEIDIPSVLGNTLNTKLNAFKDDTVNESCHIYRHLLQTSVIGKDDIETAVNDLSNFENWLKESENRDKLEDNQEINEIHHEMIEQRNKLKQQNDLSPSELRLTLTAELERAKLNALKQELQSNEELEKEQELKQQEMDKDTTQETIDKENKMKAREIRKVQIQNQEKLVSEKQENVPYFENEPFLRDYEINQLLLEIFSFFIKIWNENQQNQPIITDQNEEINAAFIDTLSLLKLLCQRLREIISVKTLDANLKALSVREEIMVNLIKNEFSTKHIHNLLCAVGFRLASKSDDGYIPKESNIYIDAGICNILSKLDEYHAKFKKYLFKSNNHNIEYVKTFEMDLKTKMINDITDDIHSFDIQQHHHHHHHHKTNVNTNKFNNEAIDTPYFPQSPSKSVVSDYNGNESKPGLERCVSHCSCCPIDSPNRPTKMDYLGRSRNHIISMDDLENYPKPVDAKNLNYKYIQTEASVQRRVRTSSTFNTSLMLQDAFPTIVIQPHVFDFGNILIGYVYRFSATITNHGNNQARFNIDIHRSDDDEECRNIHIKPYYRSGGIAPGITILLELEFCSTDFIGQYSTSLTIKTQKHVFNVNVKANIMESGDEPMIDINSNDDLNLNNKKSRVYCLGKKQ